MADTKMVAIHNMDPKLWERIKLDAFKKRTALSIYVQQLLRSALKGDAK